MWLRDRETRSEKLKRDETYRASVHCKNFHKETIVTTLQITVTLPPVTCMMQRKTVALRVTGGCYDHATFALCNLCSIAFDNCERREALYAD